MSFKTQKRVLEVSGLEKRFDVFPSPRSQILFALTGGRFGKALSHIALKGISFDIAAGETLGVLGRNGAGKTTLLYLLAGSLKPTNGTISVPERSEPLNS